MAKWSASGMCVVALLATAPTLLLAALNEPSSLPTKVLISLLILAFSTTGALVASRQPGNAIGWLFCVGSLVWILGELALEYAVYALVTSPGALPGGAWMTWFGGWARGMGWFLVVAFSLLLFPNGRLPSPRWRPVLWGVVAFVTLLTLGSLLSPTSIDLRLTFVANPLGADLGIGVVFQDLANLLSPLLVMAVGAAAIVRFRRSRGDERQQLKWFAYAVAVMVALFVLGLSLAIVGFLPLSAALWTVPLIGLPIATGIAILKYRLYDIDLLINRTLVYGALSAVLALVYAGGVVGLGGLVQSVGGQSNNNLVVAASTLAVAGLFRPARARIQAFIDRRFYRTKYDAARTLDAFSAKLRDEISLDALTQELLAVVNHTMQPAHASLWLRQAVESVSTTGRESLPD